MINMMKSDFYRIIRTKVFYIAIGFLFLIIGVSIYGVQPGYIGTTTLETTQESILDEIPYEEMQNLSIGNFRKMMLESEGYELDRDILGANINLYYIFIFVAVIVLTSDFSGGSIKNTLSSAISRRKYFFAKLSFIMLCCVGLFFMNTYLVYFSNIIFNGKNLSSSLIEVTKISLIQLPAILALVSILTGIGFIVKKTAFFNTLTIPLILIVQLLLSFFVKLFKIKKSFLNYEFQTMITKFAGNPSDSYLLHSYIFCAVIIVLFCLLGYMAFRKVEIK